MLCSNDVGGFEIAAGGTSALTSCVCHGRPRPCSSSQGDHAASRSPVMPQEARSGGHVPHGDRLRESCPCVCKSCVCHGPPDRAFSTETGTMEPMLTSCLHFETADPGVPQASRTHLASPLLHSAVPVRTRMTTAIPPLCQPNEIELDSPRCSGQSCGLPSSSTYFGRIPHPSARTRNHRHLDQQPRCNRVARDHSRADASGIASTSRP